MQTLRFVMSTLDYVKSKDIEVRFHGRGKNEASHYCGQCEVSVGLGNLAFYSRYSLICAWCKTRMSFFDSNVLHLQQVEVFNVLFIREQEKRHVVHCLSCARKQSTNLQGFVCLEEYRLKELTDIYDKFVLSKPLPPPVPTIPQNALSATQQQSQQKETPVAS